eukprot:2413654-Pyramimonas_sp.AAC.1
MPVPERKARAACLPGNNSSNNNTRQLACKGFNGRPAGRTDRHAALAPSPLTANPPPLTCRDPDEGHQTIPNRTTACTRTEYILPSLLRLIPPPGNPPVPPPIGSRPRYNLPSLLRLVPAP